jgi:lactaldehyde dehydrogenase/glycolaldehyde dehydrogenase
VSTLHTAVQAINDTNFGQVYVDKIGPEQLQGLRPGYRNSGMGDDATARYEEHLGRKTMYVVPYEDFRASAEIHL